MLAEPLVGSSVPTLSRVPPGPLDFSVADRVLGWVDSLGMTLFGWQRDVLRLGLALRGGRWAAYEVDLVLPRQNGKNEVLVALELAAVGLLGKRLVVHSAHEALTAAKHFVRFQQLADELPGVEALLPVSKTRGFYTANGNQHIAFRNGAVIDFRTRTRSAGRGFSTDLIVLDEAFQLPAAAVGSLLYTLRARKNPQVWRTSSAAHADSVVLHADARRAREADPDDARLLYLEWGNEAGCDPGDPVTWARSNPSLGLEAPGFALELQTFRNEYAAAVGDPGLLAEFVREICGVPDPPLGEAGRAMPNWRALEDGRSRVVSADQWALAVAPDRSYSAVGVAGRDRDGRLHVEVWRAKPGTDWILDTVQAKWQEKRLPIRVHVAGPEASFIMPLRECGVEVVEVTTGQFTQATGQLLDAAQNGQLSHLGQVELDQAVQGGILRTTPEGAQLWARRMATAEISPLVAVTVAAGGVPVESKKPRIM